MGSKSRRIKEREGNKETQERSIIFSKKSVSQHHMFFIVMLKGQTCSSLTQSNMNSSLAKVSLL